MVDSAGSDVWGDLREGRKMRVTVDPEDKAFDPNFNTENVAVYFDGELITNCVTADDELSMVLCRVDDGPAGIEYEWFEGDVRILIFKEESENGISGSIKTAD